MKLPAPSVRRCEQGVAVIVVLALLAILMLYIAANVRSLRIMSQEIKLVEQRQFRRWSSVTAVRGQPESTNVVKDPKVNEPK